MAPAFAARRSLSTTLSPRTGQALGWGLAIAWFVALAVFFDRNSELKGNGLFQPRQYAAYLGAWLPELRELVLFGIVGVLLALVAWARSGPMREGIALLVLTALCSAPLVLLVIAVGEPPRNYLAQIGILVALGAAGWFWAAELVVLRLLPRLSRARPPEGGLLPRPLLVLGFVAVFLASSVFLARHAVAYRESASGQARAAAVRTTTDWIKANVPAGTPIGFGSFLGHEMSSELRGRHPMVQTGQGLVVADPGAPFGLAAFNQPAVTDFIAVDIAPRRALEFYAVRASTFGRIHMSRGTRIYVHTTGTTTSVPSVVAALRPENGFTPLAQWSFEVVARNGTVSTDRAARLRGRARRDRLHRQPDRVHPRRPGPPDRAARGELRGHLDGRPEPARAGRGGRPGPDDAALRARLEALAAG